MTETALFCVACGATLVGDNPFFCSRCGAVVPTAQANPSSRVESARSPDTSAPVVTLRTSSTNPPPAPARSTQSVSGSGSGGSGSPTLWGMPRSVAIIAGLALGLFLLWAISSMSQSNSSRSASTPTDPFAGKASGYAEGYQAVQSDSADDLRYWYIHGARNMGSLRSDIYSVCNLVLWPGFAPNPFGNPSAELPPSYQKGWESGCTDAWLAKGSSAYTSG